MIFLKASQTARRVYLDVNAEKIERISKRIIAQMLCFLLGLLCGSINELNAFSPFAVAFVTAVSGKYTISAGLGAAAGYILTQDNLSALRYIAAIICSVILIRLTNELERLKKFRLLPSCISFMSLFLTSMAVLFADGTSVRSFFIFLSEATLGFALSFVFSSAFDALTVYSSQGGFTARDIVNVGALLSVVLLSLSGITVFSASPARIIGIFLLLLISFIYKESAGTSLGVELGLAFSLSQSVGAMGISYAVVGLASGLFSRFNRFAGTAAGLLAFLAVLLFENGTLDKIYLIVEFAIACVAFLCIPEKYLRAITGGFYEKREPVNINSQRLALLERLKNASMAVEEVSETVNAASSLLKSNIPETELDVYSRVRASVCTGCRLNSFCWSKNFADCKKAFDTMSEALKNNGVVNPNKLPPFLKGCCVKSDELTDSFNKLYISFVSSRAAKERVERMRSVSSRQFGGICDMLTEISEEFTKEIDFADELSAEIEELLISSFNITPSALVCRNSENGRLKIEFSFIKTNEKINEYELRKALEKTCRVQLDRPSITASGDEACVCFCEKTFFRVEAAASRSTANKDKYCGDSFESFYDGKGNFNVVLSDGMGTGMRAAVDSSLASSMTAKLLRSGFSHSAAFRLVNSALLLKSTEESLATLDVLSIDLYSGNATLCKAGAVATLVRKNESVTAVNRASMPLGILDEADFVSTQFKLRKGDTVVMASDGAFEYSLDTAKKLLSSEKDASVDSLAEKIAEVSKHERSKKPKDDVTVIALKLVLNE